ncbi:ABC transporter ATP-binding protein [candidate division KSB1 bacterium]|nr:ABC transporter ATP-binding protein [candidate division KSB1 bacterium]
MLLKVQNLCKTYRTPSGTDLMVLRDISFSIDRGDSMAIVGPSGSGKSTLLNIIGALDKPTAGTVELAGKKLAELSDNELATFRNQDIGFIFQLHFLLPQLTVLENVLVPTLPLGRSNGAEERARLLLERVGLGEHFDYHPAQLSGGEQQRVAVVRALINQPKLVLADEPTGSLDQDSSEKLADILKQLNRQEHVTLIVVTHSMALANKMNLVYTLKKGQLTV